MHNKQELDRRMEAAGIRPLKKLGQNFLLNPKICESVIEAVAAEGPLSVVEIGPGLGALTDGLLEKSWDLKLIEIDAGLIEYWKRVAPSLELIHQDALKLIWKDLNLAKPAVLISNLPYSIAASLVVELSSEEQPFDSLVLMFQKEVAERIDALKSSKDYGMLSVVAQANWDIRKVVDAGPQDFFPVPNVGSRVLQFKAKKVGFDRSKFLTFVKLGFSQRRKKLSSNLSGQFKKERIQEGFINLDLGPDTRAQELTPIQFVELFQFLTRAM
jgi:16S rRNA (adenine1518-N6/adenine1519-N6)-dimethyltransferase